MKIKIGFFRLPAIITIAALLCMLFLNSCDRCGEAIHHDKTNLSETAIKRLMPYTGNESLYFLKNQAETLEFIGQGIYSDYYKERVSTDCERYDYLQRKFLTFKTSGNDSFMIAIYCNTPNQGGGEEYYFVAKGKDFGPTFAGRIYSPWPPVNNTIINGIKYDTVAILYQNSNYDNYTISKPYLGVLKFRVNGNDYEIIKP